MVIGPAIRIATTIAKGIVRYNKYESKLFGTAYRGFPRGIRRGVRHGWVAGTIAGSLINQNGEDNGNAILQPQKQRYVPTTGKQYQTYRRQPRRISRRCPPERNTGFRSRQSSYYNSR